MSDDVVDSGMEKILTKEILPEVGTMADYAAVVQWMMQMELRVSYIERELGMKRGLLDTPKALLKTPPGEPQDAGRT